MLSLATVSSGEGGAGTAASPSLVSASAFARRFIVTRRVAALECDPMTERATFYTVATAGYFPGLVALLNSLRLTGHDQNLVVLDDGLTPDQRERLAPHATLVELSDLKLGLPPLKKVFPELLQVSGTVVLIDSDMIVTASLEPQLSAAAAGKLVLFPDHESTRERWFGDWEQRFALSGPPRRQTYLNAGFVAFASERWPGLLTRWREACELIPLERVAVSAGLLPRVTVMEREPYWAADQDALNAILMAEVPQEALAVQLVGLEPDWLEEVDVVDGRTLECRYRGGTPSILHFSLGPKPWQRGGWRRASHNAYIELLPRVLLGADVTLRLWPDELPFWLRDGRPAKSARSVLAARTDGSASLARLTRAGVRRLPAPLRGGLLALRDRAATLIEPRR